MKKIHGIHSGLWKKLLASAALMAALMAPHAAHADLGVDFTNQVSAAGMVENGSPGTFGASAGYTVVGWSFTPKSDLLLNRLGVFDADRDRIHSEHHYVGLWEGTTLKASVTITETPANPTPEVSPNGALFHWQNLAQPLLLKQGQTYTVGATLYAGSVGGGTSTSDFDAFAAFSRGESPIFFDSHIEYLKNAYAFNGTNGLVFPASTWNVYDYAIGANIDTSPVPLPGAVWLLGSGLAGLLAARKRMDA